MKRIVLNLVKVIGFSCLFCSCATILPVTDSLIESVGGESELKKFQYYISRDLVLNRTVRETDAGIVKGEAKLRETIQKDRIDIGKSTPGVVLHYRKISNISDRYALAVGFDAEDDNKYLLFSNETSNTGAPYLLWTPDLKTVGYGGGIYNFSLPDKLAPVKKLKILKSKTKYSGDLPCLLVKLNKKSIIKKSKKTLKGRKIE